jgi:hypothetical protein
MTWLPFLPVHTCSTPVIRLISRRILFLAISDKRIILHNINQDQVYKIFLCFFLCRVADNGRNTHCNVSGCHLWTIAEVYLKEGRKNEE